MLEAGSVVARDQVCIGLQCGVREKVVVGSLVRRSWAAYMIVRPVDAELDEASAEGSGFTPRRETGRQHHGVEEQSLPTGRLDELEPPSAPWRHSEASLLPSGSHGPP